MLNDDLPEMTLAGFKDGAIEEMFQEELKLVLANCMDPNTEWKPKRKITLELTLEVGEDRGTCKVTAVTKNKLAPFRGVAGTVFCSTRRGEPVAHIYDPQQMQLDLDAADRPRVLPTESDEQRQAQ